MRGKLITNIIILLILLVVIISTFLFIGNENIMTINREVLYIISIILATIVIDIIYKPRTSTFILLLILFTIVQKILTYIKEL